ncbi:MAG: helix-turn-helix domain-containing protein [Myxococcota bacterium]
MTGALALLTEAGADAVRVEPLARRLGVTKGSFYWHFAGRDALLAAALAHWEQVETLAIIAGLEAAAPGAERLRALVRQAWAAPTARGRAVRAWAAHDDAAAEVVRRVDARRTDYVAAQFVAAGLPPEAAAGRARMLYAALVGEADLAPLEPAARVAVALDTLEAMLRP